MKPLLFVLPSASCRLAPAQAPPLAKNFFSEMLFLHFPLGHACKE